MHKKLNKRGHSVGSMLAVVVLIISIFSIGFYTENNDFNFNNPNNQITAAAVGMEKVTGFATFYFTIKDPNGKQVTNENGNKIILSSDGENVVIAKDNLRLPAGYTATQTTTPPPPQDVGPEVIKLGNNYQVRYGKKYFPATTDETAANNQKVELERFEKLKENNPNLNDEQLWNLYFRTSQYENEEAANQVARQLGFEIETPLPTPTGQAEPARLPEQLKGADGNPIDAWKLPDGKITYDKKEVDAIIEKQFLEDARKSQGLTLMNQVDENGNILAKDAKGEVYKFTPTKDGERITGGSFNPVGDSYTTKETIGEGDKAIDIVRTFKRKGRVYKQEKIEAKKDGKSVTVDEETLRQIKNADKKGLSLIIEKGGENPTLSFQDDNNREIERISNEVKGGIKFKTIEAFSYDNYIYNGRIITKKEYDNLNDEEKDKAKSIERLQTYKRVEERDNNGNLKFVTDYNYKPEVKEGSAVQIYEATITNQENNRIVNFIYGEDGKVIRYKINGGEGIGFGTPFGIFIDLEFESGDMSLDAEGRLRAKQLSSRVFFYQLESILTDFSGLGYYATLFFDDEDLDEWRESVDKTFATSYLGTEYWTSDICAASTDIDRSNQGVAYVDTKLGLAAVAAHIEASRSEQFIGPGTEDERTGIVKPTREFLYKITFNVKNGDWDDDPKALEKMRFNVVLKGERSAKLFRQDIELKKGDQFGHIGRDAIAQFSDFFYDTICIDFENTPSSWNLDDDELCNTIAGPSAPTSVGQSQQPSQQQETGEGNVNDI